MGIYIFLQNHSVEEAAKEYNVTEKAVASIKNIGDALTTNRPKPLNSKPLNMFTPRELMEELARRGYKGKLLYTSEVDIERL